MFHAWGVPLLLHHGMHNVRDDTLNRLHALAREAASSARAPYSGRAEAVVLLLADGAWVPGVRVESASYSLLLPAVVNAFTTAVAAGRHDVVAAVFSGPALDEEAAYLAESPAGRFVRVAPEWFVRAAADGAGAPGLPPLGERLDPFLPGPAPESPEAGVAQARTVAGRAHVPESGFTVGCVLETGDGHLIPGVNVEHRDWTRILCAERNAIGTAVSYDVGPLRRLYLSCPADPAGTPCGACRQHLAEHAREIALWMDRGRGVPEETSPERLLPGSFTGQRLTRRL